MAKVNVQMTAEELNKFIGGDNELALKLKNSIVQQFSKRYLKGVVSDGLDEVEESIKKYVDQQITKKILKIERVRYEDYVQLNQTVKKKIDSHVTPIINAAVFKTAKESADTILKTDRVTKMEDNIFQYVLERYNKMKSTEIIKRVEAVLKNS
jgi:hypothetical protein